MSMEISDATRERVLFVFSVIQSPVIVCGWITNVINIITFIRLGLKDSITLSFFFLTCSDLICLLIMFPGIYLAYILPFLTINWQANGSVALVAVIYYYLMFYDVSKLITTFIALQRCCCVAMPFHFKNTFTCTRTAIITATIVVFSIATYIPKLSLQELTHVSDFSNDSSLLVLSRSNAWQDYAFVYNITNSILMTTVCHVTVLSCLFILASSLNSSSRFRLSTSMPQSYNKQKGLHDKINNTKIQDICHRGKEKYNEEKAEADKSNTAKTTKTKEIQAIKSTILLSIIFLVCNTPKVIMGYAKLFEPRFSLNQQFGNLHFICNTMKNTLEIINASTSMFVYLSCNTRYRKTLISFLGTIHVKWLQQKINPTKVNNEH